MLCQGDQGHGGTWIWIAVSDADASIPSCRLGAPAAASAGELSVGLARVSNHGPRRATSSDSDRIFAPASRWVTGSTPQGSDGSGRGRGLAAREEASDDSQTHGRPISAWTQEKDRNGQAPQSGHLRDPGGRHEADSVRSAGANSSPASHSCTPGRSPSGRRKSLTPSTRLPKNRDASYVLGGASELRLDSTSSFGLRADPSHPAHYNQER